MRQRAGSTDCWVTCRTSPEAIRAKALSRPRSEEGRGRRSSANGAGAGVSPSFDSRPSRYSSCLRDIFDHLSLVRPGAVPAATHQLFDLAEGLIQIRPAALVG